jgi:hypothetical protein
MRSAHRSQQAASGGGIPGLQGEGKQRKSRPRHSRRPRNGSQALHLLLDLLISISLFYIIFISFANNTKKMT